MVLVTGRSLQDRPIENVESPAQGIDRLCTSARANEGRASHVSVTLSPAALRGGASSSVGSTDRGVSPGTLHGGGCLTRSCKGAGRTMKKNGGPQQWGMLGKSKTRKVMKHFFPPLFVPLREVLNPRGMLWIF